MNNTNNSSNNNNNNNDIDKINVSQCEMWSVAEDEGIKVWSILNENKK